MAWRLQPGESERVSHKGWCTGCTCGAAPVTPNRPVTDNRASTGQLVPMSDPYDPGNVCGLDRNVHVRPPIPDPVPGMAATVDDID